MRIQNVYEMTVAELQDYVRGCQTILEEKISNQEAIAWAELKTAVKKYLNSIDNDCLCFTTEEDEFCLDITDIDYAMQDKGIINIEFDRN